MFQRALIVALFHLFLALLYLSTLFLLYMSSLCDDLVGNVVSHRGLIKLSKSKGATLLPPLEFVHYAPLHDANVKINFNLEKHFTVSCL